MSFLTNKRPVDAEVICLAALPDQVIRNRKSVRLGIMLLATVTYFALTGFAWAFMTPGGGAPAPDPNPPSTSDPAPREPSQPEINNNPNAGEDRERSTRKVRRSYRPKPQVNRAAITDQTYYGGKLGIQPGSAMSFISTAPASKPDREER